MPSHLGVMQDASIVYKSMQPSACDLRDDTVHSPGRDQVDLQQLNFFRLRPSDIRAGESTAIPRSHAPHSSQSTQQWWLPLSPYRRR